jgi:hypothetical protein
VHSGREVTNPEVKNLLFGEEQPNDHSIEQAQSHNDDRESGILVAYQLQAKDIGWRVAPSLFHS